MKTTVSSIIAHIVILLSSTYLSNAQFTLLHSFNGATGGGNPKGNLLEINGILYGTAATAGAGLQGVIFKINIDGTGYTVMKACSSGTSLGKSPMGGLVRNGATLYGTLSSSSNGNGGYFKIDTNALNYTEYLISSPTTGKSPRGTPLIYNSTLYCMTNDGGALDYGTIITKGTGSTTISSILAFNSYGVRDPYGDLALSGDTLFGMTNYGGTYDKGAIFKIKTNGTSYSTLHSFNSPEGFYPYGGLLLIGDTLFGMTYAGGDSLMGSIFKINRDGTGYAEVYSFNQSMGISPRGNLTLHGKYLYGVTTRGGSRNLGVLFRIRKDGTGYQKLYDFEGGTASGSTPAFESLIVVNNKLYGMTDLGGASNRGTIYSYQLPLDVESTTQKVCAGKTNVSLGSDDYASGGVPPYTYSWSPTTGLSSATEKNPILNEVSGDVTYTVTVTDNASHTASGTLTLSAGTMSINEKGTYRYSRGSSFDLGSVLNITNGHSPFSYSWSDEESWTSTEQNPMISNAKIKRYKLTLRDSYGCECEGYYHTIPK